ncbi:hypothetical protein Goshw_017487, partial [Gossypium schwendimanii]|nr:hypothetical protein [Gossypium schwendimanii]
VPTLLERPNLILSNNSIDILNSEDGPDARLHNVYMDAPTDMIFKENILVEAGKCLESASKVGSNSCLRESPEVDNGSSNVLENRTLLLDEILNDWHITIFSQQGVFTMQVFELHQLIKVKRLIIGSPHMLLEDTLHMAKPSLDVSSIKKSPSNYVPKPPMFLKNSSQTTNISIKHGNDDAVANLPLPSAINDTNKRAVPRQPKYMPYSRNLLSTPMATNTRPSTSCFSPTRSQWLVPITTPSEGLVYKPYTDLCPPTLGFLVPVYGNCGGFSNSHQ